MRKLSYKHLLNTISKKKPSTYLLLGALVLLVLVLPLTIFLAKQSQETRSNAAGSAHTYFVSRNGNNADGLSWTTAWNELASINWSVVQPGDTVILDGGTNGMTYATILTIGKS